MSVFGVFCSVIFRIWTEYREILHIQSEYGKNQKNSEYGHISRSGKRKKMFEDMWMKSRSEISLILDFRDREFLFLSFSYFLVKRVIYNLETFSDQVKRDQRIENTSYLWRFWAHSKLVLVVGRVSVFRIIKIIYWN